MHIKLDENADPRWRVPFEGIGCIVSTAVEEGLAGFDDEVIAKNCLENRYTLVTLDQGFAQIIHYPPELYSGIVVLRHAKPTLTAMKNLVEQAAQALSQRSPAGELWIVQPGRIRIHGQREPR